MNFLEICQQVDRMSGVQGMIQTVQNVVGAQEVIVGAVRDSFIDLQQERMTWEWMRRMVTFQTKVAKESYNEFDIFGPPPDPPPAPGGPHDAFGRWQKKHPVMSYRVQDPDDLKWSKMIWVDFREYRHHLMNQRLDGGKPRYVTADENTDELLLHPRPDKIYTVQADYFVEPQILSDNADVPCLPSRFHMLLVYRGIQRVANFYGNAGLWQQYNMDHSKMTGNLMRDQVPGETVVIRSVA